MNGQGLGQGMEVGRTGGYGGEQRKGFTWREQWFQLLTCRGFLKMELLGPRVSRACVSSTLHRAVREGVRRFGKSGQGGLSTALMHGKQAGRCCCHYYYNYLCQSNG